MKKNSKTKRKLTAAVYLQASTLLQSCSSALRHLTRREGGGGGQRGGAARERRADDEGGARGARNKETIVKGFHLSRLQRPGYLSNLRRRAYISPRAFLLSTRSFSILPPLPPPAHPSDPFNACPLTPPLSTAPFYPTHSPRPFLQPPPPIPSPFSISFLYDHRVENGLNGSFIYEILEPLQTPY